MKKYIFSVFKKNLLKILAVVCTLAVSVAILRIYMPQSISQTFSKTSVLPTVVIDAGHGGLTNTTH